MKLNQTVQIERNGHTLTGTIKEIKDNGHHFNILVETKLGTTWANKEELKEPITFYIETWSESELED